MGEARTGQFWLAGAFREQAWLPATNPTGIAGPTVLRVATIIGQIGTDHEEWFAQGGLG